MRFNHDDPNELAQAAATVLRTHPHVVLGTANAQVPWAVPVHQVTGPDGRLYWQSAQDARHSQNIAANPHVSGVLYSATADQGEVSLYLEGTARVLEDPAEVRDALAVRFAGRDQPPPDTLLGESRFRLYALTPTAAWINDDSHTKTAVDMTLLRRHLHG